MAGEMPGAPGAGPIWWLAGAPDRWFTAAQALALVRARITSGTPWASLESDAGVSLELVANGERLFVMLTGPGEASGHAVDDLAAGFSSGYRLENGQVDEYADADTVPLASGFALVEEVLGTGAAPDDGWQVDVE